MRIVYGVHGYGRGHSSRALAVLPELTARHEVLLLAGDDAYHALRKEYPVQRIPVLRYEQDARGRRRPWRTLKRALPLVLDLHLRGPGLAMVTDMITAFGPDVVISDSEPLTHGAANNLRLPRISFDHFGVLVYCRWPMNARQRLAGRFEAAVYRRLMAGAADRVVIVSFYPAPPRQEGVQVVGPVLRPLVLQTPPRDDGYLMVYLSNGRHHWTPAVRQAVEGLGVPTRVYGVGREGTEGHLAYRPPSNRQFVEDLAGCRALFATAGNQLISEAMYFRKPMLLLPEDSLEQRLNARAVEEMGIGMQTRRHRVSTAQLRTLLEQADAFAARMPQASADGRLAAVAAIERFAEELAAAPRPAQ